MKEWKAAEKEAQKMTRDGAISVNMVTGEASHVSDRAPEQDYSPSGDSAVFVHSAAERLDTIGRDELAGMLYENSDEPYCEELAKAITEDRKSVV